MRKRNNKDRQTMTHISVAQKVLVGVAFVASSFVFAASFFIIPKENLCTSVSCKNVSSGKTSFTSKIPAQDTLVYQHILNYPSLSGIKNRLQGIAFVEIATGTPITALQLVNKLLTVYAPTAVGVAKEKILGDFFNQYELADTNFKNYKQQKIAYQIFITNVANGVWTEKNGKVPWSLAKMNEAELSQLYIPYDLFGDGYEVGSPVAPSIPGVSLQGFVYPSLTPIHQEANYKLYNLAHSLVGKAKTQTEVVDNVVFWMQQNFFHADEKYGWDQYKDNQTEGDKVPFGENGSYYAPLSLSRIFDERVIGCQEPTVILANLLHNLNIPAIRLSEHGHGVVYLPSLNRYVHGDAIAIIKSPKGFIVQTTAAFTNMVALNDFIQPLTDAHASLFPAYLTLQREGNTLKLSSGNFYVYPAKTCTVISPAQWSTLITGYENFQPYYDTTTCRIEGAVSQFIQPLNAY